MFASIGLAVPTPARRCYNFIFTAAAAAAATVAATTAAAVTTTKPGLDPGPQHLQQYRCK